MTTTWNVLVVDDEPDIHKITRLVLRRKTWKGRPIALTTAHSAEEARKILGAPDCPLFHAALVDVVMESWDAGLQLCGFIRSNCPPSLRIVLRTGQPGVAPEEAILRQYDIDYYLAKTEVTEERLYATLRACFRNSQDMLGVLAITSQLRALTSAIRDPNATMHTLVEVMTTKLEFLEEKYTVKLTFVHNVDGAAEEAKLQKDGAAYLEVARAIDEAHKAKLPPMEMHPGPLVGLPAGTWLVVTPGLKSGEPKEAAVKKNPLSRWFSSVLDKHVPKKVAGGGVAIRFEGEWPAPTQHEFLLDLEVFITNWTLVEEVFTLERQPNRDFIDII